jgi:hypothetical protein
MTVESRFRNVVGREFHGGRRDRATLFRFRKKSANRFARFHLKFDGMIAAWADESARCRGNCHPFGPRHLPMMA